jgi:hypothetical protein
MANQSKVTRGREVHPFLRVVIITLHLFHNEDCGEIGGTARLVVRDWIFPFRIQEHLLQHLFVRRFRRQRDQLTILCVERTISFVLFICGLLRTLRTVTDVFRACYDEDSTQEPSPQCLRPFRSSICFARGCTHPKECTTFIPSTADLFSYRGQREHLLQDLGLYNSPRRDRTKPLRTLMPHWISSANWPARESRWWLSGISEYTYSSYCQSLQDFPAGNWEGEYPLRTLYYRENRQATLWSYISSSHC